MSNTPKYVVEKWRDGIIVSRLIFKRAVTARSYVMRHNHIKGKFTYVGPHKAMEIE